MRAKSKINYGKTKLGDIIEVKRFADNGNYYLVPRRDYNNCFYPSELEILPDDLSQVQPTVSGCPGTVSGPATGLANVMRTFDTGATRSNDAGKLDYEGFLSPLVLQRYGEYLNKHRVQADGQIRDSDNWQKGIPRSAYIKSAFRHFVDFWKMHRATPTPAVNSEAFEDSMMAVLFNVMGYAHEHLKEKHGSE
jgi:hypothetical protein